MRFRVSAVAFLAVLCGSALYAQLPERVTFQPATFGYATHYGYYNANVGGSAKMTYANTNLANRNTHRGGVVVHSYGLEPTKVVGFSQPEYRVRVRPIRIGRFYTPINTMDCLCASGGMVEIPQNPPQIKSGAGIEEPLKEKPIIPSPVAKPDVIVETPVVEKPVVEKPIVAKPDVPVAPPQEKTLPTPPVRPIPQPVVVDEDIVVVDEDIEADPFNSISDPFDTVPPTKKNTADDEEVVVDPFDDIFSNTDDDTFDTVPPVKKNTADDEDDLFDFGNGFSIETDDDAFDAVPPVKKNTADDEDDLFDFDNGFSVDTNDDDNLF